MKKQTREEIEREYAAQREAVINQYYAQMDAAKVARDAALAELEDPMLRLITAGKGWLEQHGNCSYEPCNALRDAIDYAKQRRAQG